MSRVWVIFKRVGRLLKFLLFCLILTICILLLWRVFSTSTPKDIKDLDANADMKAAYAQKGDELYVFKQMYDEITRHERNAGYFGVPEAELIPDANQAQIVFRYNNSTLREVASDYSLSSIPSRDSDLFDVSMVVCVDLTPENKDDNIGDKLANFKNIRIKASSEQRSKNTLYNFKRLVFEFENGEEPLDLSELLEKNAIIAIYVDVYYKEDLDYEKAAYGTLCVYDYRANNIAVKLSGKEKKALGE